MPYKAHLIRNPNVTGRGLGKPGYCSLCDLVNTRPDIRKTVNALFVNQKAPAITAWLEANVDMKPDRRTVYSHKKHVLNPKDRLVSQVAAQRAKGTLPAKVTDDEYWDAVLTAAMQQVIDNPEGVTVEHGLKAAAARSAAKASRAGGILVLQLALKEPLTERPSLLIGDGSIEGDYSEVS